uniref:Uncharacterized protein n=1 Tax=Anguilla anguilla TaxID=7936 RepID=A0A0E9Q685_ANGAN
MSKDAPSSNPMDTLFNLPYLWQTKLTSSFWGCYLNN